MDHCSLVVGEMAVAQLGVSAVRPASLRSPDARLAGAKALRPNFPTRRRRVVWEVVTWRVAGAIDWAWPRRWRLLHRDEPGGRGRR